MRTKAFKPPRHVYVAPDGSRWRGGQLRSLNGETATIRLHSEVSIVSDYEVAAALLPAGLTIGDALMCRVTGPFPYVITEVRGSRFAPGAPSDQEASVARGEFFPGIVPYEFSGEDDCWWEIGEEPPRRELRII
jgi:hypothetical protein